MTWKSPKVQAKLSSENATTSTNQIWKRSSLLAVSSKTVSILTLVIVQYPGLVALLLEYPDVSEIEPESEHSQIDQDNPYQRHLMNHHQSYSFCLFWNARPSVKIWKEQSLARHISTFNYLDYPMDTESWGNSPLCLAFSSALMAVSWLL